MAHTTGIFQTDRETHPQLQCVFGSPKGGLEHKDYINVDRYVGQEETLHTNNIRPLELRGCRENRATHAESVDPFREPGEELPE
jgi:hypothetical protein